MIVFRVEFQHADKSNRVIYLTAQDVKSAIVRVEQTYERVRILDVGKVCELDFE